jgi:hypothetical protein
MANGMGHGHDIEVLRRHHEVELVRHRDGHRELRRTERTLDSMDAAFHAIAVATLIA